MPRAESGRGGGAPGRSAQMLRVLRGFPNRARRAAGAAAGSGRSVALG